MQFATLLRAPTLWKQCLCTADCEAHTTQHHTVRSLLLSTAGQRPVFMNPPLSSSAYAHRQGQLSVQLPVGATNLKLRLKSHEGFVFGTAYSPETVAGEVLV
jgi:hypothetical protein